MNSRREYVRLISQGAELAGVLCLPAAANPVPSLIICHGAGEFKEHYLEMCDWLAGRDVASLALDMHGHGESGGKRFHVEMCDWVADIQASIDFLSRRPELDGNRIGAFGLSSGGTAILEAGALDARLKVLIALDATVHDSLPWIMSLMVKALLRVGALKQRLTGTGLRVPLAKLSVGPKLASDPEINRSLLKDPKALEAFMAFPLPGAEQAFFVDTLKRVSRIQVPTLVLWGEDDTLDPPDTGRLLFQALTCKKRLHIIPGNGHVGHLDRNREKVFALTTDWVLENLPNESVAFNAIQTAQDQE